jgi:hypothetical protein
MRADLAIWDVADPAELSYGIGSTPASRIFGTVGMTHTLTPGAGLAASLEAPLARHRPGAGGPRRPPESRPPPLVIREVARGDAPVYGVNTGFGKLASVRIAPNDTETLQRNLILSAIAAAWANRWTRTTCADDGLKLLSLGRGASGVRWEICALIEAMLAPASCRLSRNRDRSARRAIWRRWPIWPP